MTIRMRLLLVAAALLAASACASQRPSLHYKATNLQEIDLDGTTLDVVFTLKNPIPVGIKLARVKYELDVENHHVVSGAPPNGFHVGASTSSDLHFPARIRFKDVFPVLQVLWSKDQASYKVSGEIGVDTPLGVLALPMSHAATFPVPKLPSFSIESPSIQNISPIGARLLVPIRVSNRNGFPLPIGGFNADIAISGAHVGSASAQMPPQLAAGESRVVNMPIDINFLQTGTAVANALRGRNATIQLQGTLHSGPAAIPINFSQQVSFNR